MTLPREPASEPPASWRALALSLKNAVRDEGALAELGRVVELGALEASVRGDGTRVAGGRMMIERAPPEALELVERTLGVRWVAEALKLVELARAEQLPLILGWDAGGGATVAKAYLNASDCSAARRARIAEALGLPLVPHVIGLNVSASGSVERKAYVQFDDAEAALGGYGERAQRLARASVQAGIAAGAVVSHDARAEGTRARAVFVALRDDDMSASARVLASLPGCSADVVRAALPFEPAPPRSVGLSLGGEAWTVYAKPQHDRRTLHALEPRATYRTATSEVGVFIEPLGPGVRSYVDTQRFALSYRVFEGEPSRSELEQLMAWLAEVVGRDEAAGAEPSLAEPPPEPWRKNEA